MSQPFQPQPHPQIQRYGEPQPPSISGPIYGPVTGQPNPYNAPTRISTGEPQPYPYGYSNAGNLYGSHVAPMPTASPKSAGVAAILSLLITGLGHLYTGNPVAAILWFFAAVISGLLIAAAVGIALLPAVWICAAVHAYMCANAFNRRHHVIH